LKFFRGPPTELALAAFLWADLVIDDGVSVAEILAEVVANIDAVKTRLLKQILSKKFACFCIKFFLFLS
jgi:hypothetical protein